MVAASSSNCSKFPDVAHLKVVTAYQSDISQGIFMGLDLFRPPKIFGRPNEIWFTGMSMIQEKTIPVFCYFSCFDLHFGCPAADSEFETWKRMISIEIFDPILCRNIWWSSALSKLLGLVWCGGFFSPHCAQIVAKGCDFVGHRFAFTYFIQYDVLGRLSQKRDCTSSPQNGVAPVEGFLFRPDCRCRTGV